MCGRILVLMAQLRDRTSLRVQMLPSLTKQAALTAAKKAEVESKLAELKDYIGFGASPRASISLALAARAWVPFLIISC